MDLAQNLDLAGVLADHRQYRPNQVAVIDGATQLSYLELADRVQALATALRAGGFGVGDRLLWLGGDSFRLLECLLAAERVGGVVCPVDSRQPDADLAFLLADCAPSVVMGDGSLTLCTETTAAVASTARWVRHDAANEYEPLLESCRGEPLPGEPIAGHLPLLMLYTPMLAGRAIGVQVSRSALITESVTVALRENTGAGHRWTVPGTMFHLASTVSTVAAVLVGSTVVISRTSVKPTSTQSRSRPGSGQILFASHRLS